MQERRTIVYKILISCGIISAANAAEREWAKK